MKQKFFIASDGTKCNIKNDEKLEQTLKKGAYDLVIKLNQLIDDGKKVILVAENHEQYSGKWLLQHGAAVLHQMIGKKPAIILEHVSNRFNPQLAKMREGKKFLPALLVPSAENGIPPYELSEHDHVAMAKGKKNLSTELLNIIEKAVELGITVLGAENKETGYSFLPTNCRAAACSPTAKDEITYVRVVRGNSAFAKEINAALEQGFDPILFLGGSLHVEDVKLDPTITLPTETPNWGETPFSTTINSVKTWLVEKYSHPVDACVTWGCFDNSLQTSDEKWSLVHERGGFDIQTHLLEIIEAEVEEEAEETSEEKSLRLR